MSYLKPNPKHLDDCARSVARQYLMLRGFRVEHVPGEPGKTRCDLTATRGPVALNIAVKGVSRLWHIPILGRKTFDRDHRLVADFLYVVYFTGKDAPRILTLPRDTLKPECILGSPDRGWHLSPRFTNATLLKPLLHPL